MVVTGLWWVGDNSRSGYAGGILQPNWLTPLAPALSAWLGQGPPTQGRRQPMHGAKGYLPTSMKPLQYFNNGSGRIFVPANTSPEREGRLSQPQDIKQTLHLENMWTPPLETQLPTCQHFIVSLPTVGHVSVGEHFPHQHTESPDIRLGGEVTFQDGLRGHPAQRDPSLAEVVVLTAEENHTRGWGWSPCGSHSGVK